MTKIILATASPYRQEAFHYLDLDFIAQSSNVNEYFDERPSSPEELVLHLGKLKAETVAEHHDSGIVIGSDSIGWYNKQILEKLRSREEAFQGLKSLSRNTHQFYTGIYMRNLESRQEISKVVVINIEMRNLTDSEINKYLDQDPKYNTYAIGYDPLGHYSSTFARKVDGSYNNFTRGIPLEIIVEMLSEIGYKL